MPGIHLNDDERRLLRFWDNNSDTPLLTGISITGDPGLRGITSINIDFSYPVTILCGKNGCGKTTILALSALAFHPPAEFQSYNARNLYYKKSKHGYYTFQDFFYRGPRDPDISGVKIEWRFKNCKYSSKNITKQSSKWMKYPTRPERAVHYIGASRIIPAIEYPVLRNHFHSKHKRIKPDSLDSDFIKDYGYILERNYNEAGRLTSGKYSLMVCGFGATYTGFNMGAGEETLIDMLYLIQEAPVGSLIVIEEVELGLHPSAQKRLAEVLIKVSLKKKMQIICSSHSYEFIDSWPRHARILLENNLSEHNVVAKCTARFALGRILDKSVPEIKILCEDTFALSIINALLDGAFRERVQIVPIGDKGAVIKQLAAHFKGRYEGKCIAILDGDAKKAEACKLLQKELECNKDVSCELCNIMILPGEEKPESWVVSKLLCEESYFEMFAELLNYKRDKDALKRYCSECMATTNHHNIPYQLSQKVNMPSEDIVKFMIVSIHHDSELEEVKTFIERVLSGELTLRF